jgi:hypothetical protein
MAALDLITLADLKTWIPLTGTGRDSVLKLFITAASRALETELGRRFRYRAPPEVEGAANIVAEAVIADGNLTIASQPNAAGRTLIVTVTDANNSITAGTVTATGTVGGVAGVTEVFDLALGLEQHGLKFFTALTGLSVAGLAGQAVADKVKVGSSLGYVDYHKPDGGPELPSLEWPVRNILELNEDAARDFGSSTKLVADTDYLVTRRSEGDFLIRLSSKLPTAWESGWRSIKQVYSAGYSAGNVPEDLKDACRRLVQLLYEEIAKDRLGMSGVSDSLGNWTRFAASGITREMRRQLQGFYRNRFGADTAERDFDLEAA